MQNTRFFPPKLKDADEKFKYFLANSEKHSLNMVILYKIRFLTFRLDDVAVMDLQRQLAFKDDQLTETRLEALSSAAQVESLREAVAKLRTDLRRVEKDNEDLKAKLSQQVNSRQGRKSNLNLLRNDK